MSSAVPLPLPLSLCCLTQAAAEVPGHWHLPPAHSHHTPLPPCDIKGSLTKPRATEGRSPSRSRPGSGRSVLKQHCPLLRSPNGSCVWSGPFPPPSYISFSSCCFTQSSPMKIQAQVHKDSFLTNNNSKLTLPSFTGISTCAWLAFNSY